MPRSKRGSHGLYLRNTYYKDFPDAEKYAEMLQIPDYKWLPKSYWRQLSQLGYGFRQLDPFLYAGLPTQETLDRILARKPIAETGEINLERRSILWFNIFGSSRQEARLDLVTEEGNNVFFLWANFDGSKMERLPVLATKREYAQPMLLHQVLKRVQNAKFK